MAGSCERGNEPFGSTEGIVISSILVAEHLWFVENTFALPRLLAGCCQMSVGRGGEGESWFHTVEYPGIFFGGFNKFR
jgi:hypothetical protein